MTPPCRIGGYAAETTSPKLFSGYLGARPEAHPFAIACPEMGWKAGLFKPSHARSNNCCFCLKNKNLSISCVKPNGANDGLLPLDEIGYHHPVKDFDPDFESMAPHGGCKDPSVHINTFQYTGAIFMKLSTFTLYKFNAP
jgi:hypothetical protein